MNRTEQINRAMKRHARRLIRAAVGKWAIAVIGGVVLFGLMAASPALGAAGWRVNMVACMPVPGGECYAINDDWQPTGGYKSESKCLKRRAEMIVGLHAVMARQGVQMVVTAGCVKVGEPA